MNLVLPLPGEDAAGLLGRQVQANGFVNIAATKEEILRVHSQLFGGVGKIPIFAALADLLEIDRTKFLMAHSVVPVKRAVHHHEHQFRFGDLKARNFQADAGLEPEKGRWLLCRRCVSEDLDFHGFSYWRRLHQLPGVDWCLTHNEALEYPVNANAVEREPNAHLGDCSAPSAAAIAVLRENPVLKRMAQLMEDCLNHDRPLNPEVVGPTLRNLAAEAELRTSLRGTQKNLADLAVEKLPTEWLNRFFSGILERRAAAPFPSLENATRTGVNGSVALPFFLASALLSQCPDKLLTQLRSGLPPPRQIQQHKRPPGYWDDPFIVKEYINHRGNATKLAKSMGLDRSLTIDALKRRGMPPIPANKPKLALALRDFFGGMSIADACQNNGLPTSAVEELLRLACVHLKAAVRGKNTSPREKRRSKVTSAQQAPPACLTKAPERIAVEST